MNFQIFTSEADIKTILCRFTSTTTNPNHLRTLKSFQITCQTAVSVVGQLTTCRLEASTPQTLTGPDLP